MNSFLHRVGCALIVAFGLASCGGGTNPSYTSKSLAGESGVEGGMAAPTQSQPETPAPSDSQHLAYPIGQAYTSFLSRSSTFSLEASYDGNHYQLTSTFTPRTDEIEPNLSSSPLKSFLFTETFRENGGSPQSDSSIIYYSLNPLQIHGERFETWPEQYAPAVAATTRSALPDVVMLNEAGPLGTWPDQYEDQHGNFHPAEKHLRWRLEEATASNAWLCIESEERETEGYVIISRCIRINAQGEALGYKVDAWLSNHLISFR